VEETVEYPEKTTDLSQVTDKLYHLEFELTLVICGGQGPGLLNILEWSLLQSEYLTSH
jgi:hypothetical protein